MEISEGRKLKTLLKRGVRMTDIAVACNCSPSMVAVCRDSDKEYVVKRDPGTGELALAHKSWRFVRKQAVKADHKRSRHY